MTLVLSSKSAWHIENISFWYQRTRAAQRKPNKKILKDNGWGLLITRHRRMRGKMVNQLQTKPTKVSKLFSDHYYTTRHCPSRFLQRSSSSHNWDHFHWTLRLNSRLRPGFGRLAKFAVRLTILSSCVSEALEKWVFCFPMTDWILFVSSVRLHARDALHLTPAGPSPEWSSPPGVALIEDQGQVGVTPYFSWVCMWERESVRACVRADVCMCILRAKSFLFSYARWWVCAWVREEASPEY